MLLGLDLGTTNIKAVLVAPDGGIVATGSAPVEIRHLGGDGVEQDIEEIWSATLAAIRQVAAGGRGADVQAIGVSSQGGAMQVLDGQGRPLGKVISWLDGRGRPYDARIVEELGRKWFAEHTGHGDSAISVGQLLRLRRRQADLLRPPNRIGYVGDLIVSRLCGRAAHDATSLSIAMLYNPSLRAADPDLLRRLGISEGQLPDLISPRTPAGGLLEDVAEQLCLPAGIPVSAAVHDQYAAVLGCGAIRVADVMFGAGTAWVFVATTDRLTPPVIDEAFACAHVIEGLYGQMVSMANGGSALTWALGLLGLGDRSFQDIETMLRSVPAGSDGLRFWPLLVGMGGARLAPQAAGRLAGLRLSHTPAHVLRAVVEGLALELARYLKFLTEGGISVSRLVMCGGAAASSITPQIVADATGVGVACTDESATSALGGAAIARGLVEGDAGLASIAESMAPPVRLVEPGEDRKLYQRLASEYAASLPAAEEGSPDR